MAAGVYSTRFMLAALTGAAAQYRVPTGKLAVIRSIEARNASAVVSAITLKISDIWIWQSSLPVSGGATHFDTRTVVYAGELVELAINQGPVHFACSGYLFNNP